MEKEKQKMEKLEAHFEERTSKLASIMISHKKRRRFDGYRHEG
jgi:hypothetical protein